MRSRLRATGLRTKFFRFSGERDGTVVFIGHLGWQPNIDAAVWFCREVWPRVVAADPARRLLLVGRRPASRVLALAGKSIEVHPDVPSVVEFFGRAATSVAPLLAAGGTRIKILESLGSGTPVVATAMGALGLESLEGRYLQICSDPAAMADAVLSSCAEPADRAQVRSLVQDYGWERALEPLANTLARITTTDE